ncbi:hypothetical protein [Pseudomonas sp. PONIH3]|uniref:DUF7693 family protein n=1 Tax=Pseudomonas sp. PONIH3 TaxID=1636610 RepID=UPI000CDBE4F8|nr:hypothetical protein [Pseudomonas sp. PONIH3]AUY32393.1 hypothetical protein C3F42_03785 [Pseudomonas sp. PONIH3]
MTTVASREAYQCLRDAALGVRPLVTVARLAGDQVEVLVEGWRLTLVLDSEGLTHCSHCQCPDGRLGSLDDWHRYGTNPVDHLSLWERRQIERLLSVMPA